MPDFEGQVMLVPPDVAIAQMYFVSRCSAEKVEVRFSSDDPGADPGYAEAWEKLGDKLLRDGRGAVAERSGVASIHIGCPHCFVSVAAAAEYGVPNDHRSQRGFNPAYKILQREHRALVSTNPRNDTD